MHPSRKQTERSPAERNIRRLYADCECLFIMQTAEIISVITALQLIQALADPGYLPY